MKRSVLYFVGAACAVVIPFVALTSASPDRMNVPQFTIAHSKYSNWTGREYDMVFNREGDFAFAWDAAFGMRVDQPRVDFKVFDVIAVFRGQKDSHGHDVDIAEVINRGTQLSVIVKDIEPARTFPDRPPFPSPVEFIKIPKMGLPVVFNHIPVVQ